MQLVIIATDKDVISSWRLFSMLSILASSGTLHMLQKCLALDLLGSQNFLLQETAGMVARSRHGDSWRHSTPTWGTFKSTSSWLYLRPISLRRAKGTLSHTGALFKLVMISYGKKKQCRRYIWLCGVVPLPGFQGLELDRQTCVASTLIH